MCPSSRFPKDKVVTILSRDAPFRQITEVSEYRFNEILPQYCVLNIGANVGAFCIRAVRCARQVTAVEPVTTALLRKNIRANNVSVQVLDSGLSNGKLAVICGLTCG
ncbi:MAG: hypothetical protein WCF90_07530 [Methanomicrobiales archaeon]